MLFSAGAMRVEAQNIGVDRLARDALFEEIGANAIGLGGLDTIRVGQAVPEAALRVLVLDRRHQAQLDNLLLDRLHAASLFI